LTCGSLSSPGHYKVTGLFAYSLGVARAAGKILGLASNDRCVFEIADGPRSEIAARGGHSDADAHSFWRLTTRDAPEHENAAGSINFGRL
jgi:hypothetical protein